MLALFDGKPTRTEKIAPWPFYGNDEIDAARNTLISGKVNYWTGHLTKSFENEFARYHKMKYGIALANGTLALELALYGLGIGDGDEVITASKTFIASASCIVQRGAIPVVADVELGSQNLSARTVEPLITSKTRAVIVVHLGGMPCEMPELVELCKKHNLYLIEDCAQAHGAKINNRLVGSFGDISAFSFCQDKIISTAGEGGMLLVDDEKLYKKMWSFKDHGKSYDLANQKAPGFEFRWIHESFGTNWRMTEFQAAVGFLQLGKLEKWVDTRRKIAHEIINGLKDLPMISFYSPPENYKHAYYRLYATIDASKLGTGWSKTAIIEAINAEGIPCMTGSCSEIYLEKAFTSNFGNHERFPNAQKLSNESMALLVHPTLDSKYVRDAIAAVRKVFNVATRTVYEEYARTKRSDRIKLLRVASIPEAFVHIESQLEYLKKAHFDVTLVCSDSADLPEWGRRLNTHIEPINIARDISILADIRTLINMTKYFLKEKFTIVHSATPKAGLLTAIAAFITRVPIRIHTFTGQRWATLAGPKRWLLQMLDVLVIKLNTQCFADSQSQIDFLVQEGIAKPYEISCIGSGSFGGVNIKKFTAESAAKDRINFEKLEKIPPAKFRFIFVGRMVADKGLNELLTAFDKISQTNSDIQLILVGPKEDKKNSASSASQKIMDSHPQIFYLGSKINPEFYIKASDIFVIPSYREGFGTVVIEAAACGVPTIGTNIPGLRDAIINSRTGLLVSPKSTEELTKAMQWSIDNPSIVKEMGQQAYNRCLKEFDSEIISELTEKMYHQFLLSRLDNKGDGV